MKNKNTCQIEKISDERPALAYIRVSTEEQAADGNGLSKQVDRIRETAKRLGYSLIEISEDVGSAVGTNSFYRRHELQHVLNRAKRESMPILVSKLDRLSREPTTLHGILNIDGVEIISCDPKEMRSKRSITRAAKKARQTPANISKGTRDAFAKRKARGERFGHPETLVEGRKTSNRVRKLKSSAITDNVAIFINRKPGLADRTAQEIADALNSAGITSSRGLPWHKDNIRDVLRKAKARLQEWRADDNDEDDDEQPRRVEDGHEVSSSVEGYDPEIMRKKDPNWAVSDGTLADSRSDSLAGLESFALGDCKNGIKARQRPSAGLCVHAGA